MRNLNLKETESCIFCHKSDPNLQIFDCCNKRGPESVECVSLQNLDPKEATISMDINNAENCEASKTQSESECPFSQMKTQDYQFHLRIHDSCAEMQRMKTYQDGLEAKILSETEISETVKQELILEKEKYKNALEANKLEHEEEMKSVKEEILSYQKRDLEVRGLLDKAKDDLEETKIMLTIEKKKHKKNLTNFLCILKKSQATLNDKNQTGCPASNAASSILNLSLETFNFGIELDSEDGKDEKWGTRCLQSKSQFLHFMSCSSTTISQF